MPFLGTLLIGLSCILPIIILCDIISHRLRDRNKKAAEKKRSELLREGKIKLESCSAYPENNDEVNIALSNIEILRYRLTNIITKMNKTTANNHLLKDISNTEGAQEIYDKNQGVLDYLWKLYDKYASMRLELAFGVYVFWLNEKDINKINIKDEVDELQDDITAKICEILSVKNITTNEIINAIHKTDIEMREYMLQQRNKHIQVGFYGTIYTCKETKNVMKRIFEDINKIKIKLIAIQSSCIMSTLNPIDNEGELNLIKYFSKNEQIIVDIDLLNKEYDRFISEFEVIG